MLLSGLRVGGVLVGKLSRGGWKVLHNGRQVVWLKQNADGRQLEHCTFCGQPSGRYGNNAAPLAAGSCCDSCNTTVVLAHRMELARRGR